MDECCCFFHWSATWNVDRKRSPSVVRNEIELLAGGWWAVGLIVYQRFRFILSFYLYRCVCVSSVRRVCVCVCMSLILMRVGFLDIFLWFLFSFGLFTSFIGFLDCAHTINVTCRRPPCSIGARTEPGRRSHPRRDRRLLRLSRHGATISSSPRLAASGSFLFEQHRMRDETRRDEREELERSLAVNTECTSVCLVYYVMQFCS